MRELLSSPNENLTWSKLPNLRARKSLFTQLYASIREQLSVLESGLSIHDRILKRINASRKEMLLHAANEHINEANVLSLDELNLGSNFEHMNELNMHLIECLRLIENELNERWSKFNF